MPPPPLPPKRSDPLGLTHLTRDAARKVTPQPGRSLTPHSVDIPLSDDVTPPATPAARASIAGEAHRAEHRRSRDEINAYEELRREDAASEGRMRVYADQVVARCRASRPSGKQWTLIGAAAVAAVGGLAVAVVNNAGASTEAKAVAAALNAIAKDQVATQRQLTVLGQAIDGLSQRIDASNALMEQKLKQRPMNKDPDLISSVRRGAAESGARPEPPKPRPDPERPARRVDPDLEEPKDFGL